jgi:nicotinamide-nucleotide amidase
MGYYGPELYHSMERQLRALAQKLGERLTAAGLRMATAESCTGGWIAKVMTDIPGSSSYFERGFVTYTNESKQEMLGVRAETLDAHGAVSAATVEEMVRGALEHSSADIAVAVSGIAGPTGGSAEKPVGTIFFAWGDGEGRIKTQHQRLDGERDAIRKKAVEIALQGLLQLVAAVEK